MVTSWIGYGIVLKSAHIAHDQLLPVPFRLYCLEAKVMVVF